MIVAPSVLSFDYTNFENQIKELNENVDILHFDVMDGHFVPNLSFGPDILKAFRKTTSSHLDVHLMVDDPEKIFPIFTAAGADGITFHYEALGSVNKCLDLISLIRNDFVRVGISIKPKTPVEAIYPILPFVDLVLVMSVEPGFGGQKFMPESLVKISNLRKFRDENKLKYLIEVDGGVNNLNAHDLFLAGTDILVAGSFLFKGDIKSNVQLLSIER